MKCDKKLTIAAIIFTVLVTCLAILPTHAGAQEQKNFLWRVQAKTGSSSAYLLGSIHFFKKEMYPLNPTIENAFDQSDMLVVEANIQNINPADLQKRLMDGFYKVGDSLEQHVSRETYDLMKKESEKNGLRFEAVKQQKPWLLGLTLPSVILRKFGYDPQFGIDNYFLSKAKGRKTIRELEGIDFQIDLFSGFGEAEQELMLLYTLKELKALRPEIKRLVDAWQTGNVEELGAIESQSLKEDSRLSPIYEKMYFARNRSMAAKIEDILKGGSRCFVVVGAAHLPGEKGIIRLLEEKGYSVEQM